VKLDYTNKLNWIELAILVSIASANTSCTSYDALLDPSAGLWHIFNRRISRTFNQISTTKLKSQFIHEKVRTFSEFQSIRSTLNETNDQRTFQLRCVYLQREKKKIAPPVWERTPAYILSVFLSKTYLLFQTRRKWTCDYKKFPWISQNFSDLIFFMTFPGLEINILKFYDFPRFSMSVRTLWVWF